MIVDFKLPNPAIKKTGIKKSVPLNMFETLTVMPYSYPTVCAMSTGLVGKLNPNYTYPMHMFFDVGCGQTVIEFDQDLPDDITDRLKQIDTSDFYNEMIEQFPQEIRELSNKINKTDVENIIAKLEQCPHLEDDPIARYALNDIKTKFNQLKIKKQEQ